MSLPPLSQSSSRHPAPSYAKGWKRFLGLSLAIVMWVVFFAGMFVFARNLWLRVASASWPATTGTVVASRVALSLDQEGPSHRYPEITYRYIAGGTSFIATEGSLPGDPDAVVQQYPPRSPVTVHYDPHRPSRAFLVTGWAAIGPAAIFFLLGGAIFLGYLTLIIFRSFRNRASGVQ